MVRYRIAAFSFLLMTGGVSLAAFGQGQQDPATLIAAQREGMVPLAFMDGVWRGPAWTILPSGQKHTITQTEPIGPFLDGSVKVIEGRGYEADGKVGFNAFATISYSPATRAYTLHSYAQGLVGDFTIKLTADGYVWEIPAGPDTPRSSRMTRGARWATGSRPARSRSASSR
jgi:hypothetical protein